MNLKKNTNKFFSKYDNICLIQIMKIIRLFESLRSYQIIDDLLKSIQQFKMTQMACS